MRCYDARRGDVRMLHIFHKPLVKKARQAVVALNKGDYATGFTLAEELSMDLTHLGILKEHEAFRRMVKDYGGLWDKFDDAVSKLDELCREAEGFSGVVGEVDRTKEYGKLLRALERMIALLEWFEENEEPLRKACGEALDDMTADLKAVEGFKRVLEHID